jgi:hypothetical protein
MDRIDDPRDQADIVHAARAFFRLYGDVFRACRCRRPGAGLPLPQDQVPGGGGMKAADARVLLTGASGGIGRAMALALHAPAPR